MRPTRPSLLALLAVISGVLGVAVADLIDSLSGRTLPVPWSSVITVGALAIALFGWAWSFRRRLRSESDRVDPFVAVRTAALAMAASRTGAIIGGLYAGVGAWYVADLVPAASRERALACAIGLIMSLALIAAAVWLERLCRLPEEPDEAGSSQQSLQ
ncbi:MAG: hypothetical protein RLZ55_112 [Actinomycetota bacterium]